MMLLRSFDKFDERGEFEPTSGHLRRYSIRDDPTITSRPANGYFAHIDGHLMIFYCDAGMLHFRVDESDFTLTSGSRIWLDRSDIHILTLAQDDIPISSWSYRPYKIDEIDRSRMYLNPFIEEEQFDFGLFVSNVLSDEARKGRIFGSLADDQPV